MNEDVIPAVTSSPLLNRIRTARLWLWTFWIRAIIRAGSFRYRIRSTWHGAWTSRIIPGINSRNGCRTRIRTPLDRVRPTWLGIRSSGIRTWVVIRHRIRVLGKRIGTAWHGTWTSRVWTGISRVDIRLCIFRGHCYLLVHEQY